MRRISWLAENLLASQGLCSMELVNTGKPNIMMFPRPTRVLSYHNRVSVHVSRNAVSKGRSVSSLCTGCKRVQRLQTANRKGQFTNTKLSQQCRIISFGNRTFWRRGVLNYRAEQCCRNWYDAWFTPSLVLFNCSQWMRLQIVAESDLVFFRHVCRLSVQHSTQRLAPHRFQRNIIFWGGVTKTCPHILILVKSDKNNRHFTLRPTYI